MERFLDDCPDLVSMRRNSTELSEFSEALLVAFLNGDKPKAYVKHELTQFEFETLYKGLYNASCKNDFKQRVKVHKQKGKIILIRRRKP